MKINLIKAWKDEEYRSTLTQDQLTEIRNPAGSVELSNDDMQSINGGCSGEHTSICLTGGLSANGCCYMH
jgi:mersacidin/lichenicidin family type 2 lantibiotic